MNILPTDPKENWKNYGKAMMWGAIAGIGFIAFVIFTAFILNTYGSNS